MRSFALLPLVALANLAPPAISALAVPGAREVLLVYPAGFDAGTAAADVLGLGGVPLRPGFWSNTVVARFEGDGWDPGHLAASAAWLALAAEPGGICAALLPEQG